MRHYFIILCFDWSWGRRRPPRNSLNENPVAAFGIGWLSHYLVDFPHGDGVVRGQKETRDIGLFFCCH